MEKRCLIVFFLSFSHVRKKGPLYKVSKTERTKMPGNWKKFSLELLLTLWVDYLNIMIDWGSLKLDMIRV